MIDRNQLRDDPERITERIRRKEPDFDVATLIELDKAMRKLQAEVEQLRQQKNELAKRGRGGVTPELREQSVAIGKQLKTKETEFDRVSLQFEQLYLACPNIPEDDVPVGGKEANQVIREHGKQPTFAFELRNHLELATAAGWLDFDAASKIAGSMFPLYKDDGVRLVYALTMFMLKHNIKHGFQPILPPFLANERSLTTAGNFPKFRDQQYEIPGDDLFLIPTAEVALANMYRENIFSVEQLPVRMTAWTSCFRREAGGYGASERGLIRMHQFEKVELFSICEPEHSAQELERMLACAEDILKQLGLHYRVSLLAAQDCSFQAAKTYDIEVWFPGQQEYSEVSSVSSCTDFQARRGAIRYRASKGGKPQLVHTLNGSSLALSRFMVALIETYQQADGSIAIPDVLKNEGIF